MYQRRLQNRITNSITKGIKNLMLPGTLLEIFHAAADTKYIDAPFDERGGIMIQAPPGSFKNTLIEGALDEHHDAITLSDLNVQQWIKMRPDFISKRYTALGLPEYEKIWMRHQATAQNVEGIIHQLVSEGYMTAPNGDPRMAQIKARSLVIGGMTPDCYMRRFDGWNSSGFARRFLWFTLTVRNPEKIKEAIREWKLIDLGTINHKPASKKINMEINEEESLFLESVLREQPGAYGTGYVLFKKIAAVLKWKYAKERKPKQWREIIEDCRASLSRNGDELIL